VQHQNQIPESFSERAWRFFIDFHAFFMRYRLGIPTVRQTGPLMSLIPTAVCYSMPIAEAVLQNTNKLQTLRCLRFRFMALLLMVDIR
jgi:hypothetical protein